MAKQIKAIKCPHCGSVEKTKLDKDLYHCDNCNTDYFLDNDDININVNNRVEYGEQSYFAKNKTLSIVLTVIVVLFVILYMLVSVLSNNSTNTPNHRGGTYSVGSTTTTNTPSVQSPPKVDNEPQPLKYTDDSKVYFTFTTPRGEFYSFDLHYRDFDKKDSLNGYYYEVRNVMTGEIVKRELLQHAKKDSSTWKGFLFNNNFNYITYDDSTIYRFEEDSLAMPNVTSTFFGENREQFISGIAMLDKSAYGINQGLYILTNNGKEYIYYPQTQKLFKFSADDGNEAAKKYEEILVQTTDITNVDLEKVVYRFIHLDGSSNSYPVLVKVVYKKRDDSYSEQSSFSISMSGQENTDKPYKIKPNNGVEIVEDKILAEDRTFFDPKIIYSGKDQLIIKVKSTAAPNALYNLQSLDLNTGDVKWTLKGDDDLSFYYLSDDNAKDYFIPYKDNYILPVNNYIVKSSIGGQYVVVSKSTGKIKVISYKPEEIFE